MYIVQINISTVLNSTTHVYYYINFDYDQKGKTFLCFNGTSYTTYKQSRGRRDYFHKVKLKKDGITFAPNW